jgi:GTP-binding protein Era
LTDDASTSKETNDAAHRAGFVALLGPPNAGKSTLMNQLLGQKLAIVTAKPQTTRSRILGIHNIEGAQLLFVDTPGLHESERTLNAALNDAVDEAVRGCDVGVVLVDHTRGWEPLHDALCEKLARYEKPFVIGATKLDLPKKGKGASTEAAESEGAAIDVPANVTPCDAVVEISALRGEGVEALEAAIARALPESPPLYDPETLTDRPVRWLAGELVREALFEALGQELPYEMAVDVIKYAETSADRVTIDANILVMRDSQKRIVVGRGGSMVKRIGTRARRQIEALVGTQVRLNLFVKVDPKWLKSSKRIEALGYN